MPEAVIVSTARSPIGRAGKGSLRELRPDDLAATMVRAALADVPALDPATIDDLMLGCAQPAGEHGYNMARAVSLLAGLAEVPGVTVNRYCSSSLQTTRMALHAIKAGEGDVFVSAGVEMVSRYGNGLADSPDHARNPLFEAAAERSRTMIAEGTEWRDPALTGDLPDYYQGMGFTAENVARLTGVTRAEQDEFAALSQNRAEASIASGFWARDITPVTLPDGTVVSADDGPRAGTTVERLAQMDPVFRADGTVTAGNCCSLNDGAAALVVMSDVRAKELGITPLARIISSGVSGLSPEIMGLGPVEASRRALKLAGMSADDIDLYELNEAFAAQVVPSMRQLGIGVDKVNVHGGAIAVGHPFGMTGARMTSTLINALRWDDKETGLMSMCVGGGQGMAMVIERLS